MTLKLPTPGSLLRGLALTGLCALGSAIAATGAPSATAKHPVRAAKKAVARKAPAKPVPATPPEASADQVAAADQVFYGAYDCEFKQTVHIDKDARYPAYVDVKSGKSTWIMKPVLSSTGAIRLEDVKGETLMVQISSKSMLLNVRTAHRIVDDCVSPKQRELIEAARVAKAAEVANAAAEAASASTSASASASASASTSTAAMAPAEAASAPK